MVQPRVGNDALSNVGVGDNATKGGFLGMTRDVALDAGIEEGAKAGERERLPSQQEHLRGLRTLETSNAFWFKHVAAFFHA